MDKSQPVRILHFPDSLHRSNGRMSIVMNVFRQLDRQKIQFDFAVPRSVKSDYEEEIVALGGRVHYYSGSLRNYRQVKKFIRDLLSKYAYQVIHYHATSIWGASLPAGVTKGVKHRIIHSHNSVFSQTRLKSFRNRLFSHFTRQYATEYVACSKLAGETLFGTAKFRVLTNAIDTNKYKYDAMARQRIRSQYHFDQTTVVLGHIGRLTTTKNQSFSLKLLQRLIQSGINAKLVLLGEGPDEAALRQLVAENNLLQSVVFAGLRTDVHAFYSALDMLLMPSLYEGLPMVGVEAQTSGLPVIFSDHVTTEAGLINASFLPLSDLNSWLKQIDWLKSQNINRAQAQAMVKNAGFDVVNGTHQWQQMYEQMINR
ncbi:glycosyltransferase [Furfurilactobacillus curtus]|uniref:Glycosyl transferase family 1 n=1 Tax=Furfurilactobacillus curtus TaxID=1746200 RepID=A0ABQ5JRE7_9LACO